jgi:hypothetical protein
MSFIKELETLINRHSQENGSNTPDFILAQYLNSCLQAFNASVTTREKWYGREKKSAIELDDTSYAESLFDYKNLEFANGKWKIKNRKLSVFENYYLFKSSDLFSQDQWIETYGLSKETFDEVIKCCEQDYSEEYQTWKEICDKEDTYPGYGEVFEIATELFGSKDQAEAWLNRRNEQFLLGMTPMESISRTGSNEDILEILESLRKEE